MSNDKADGILIAIDAVMAGHRGQVNAIIFRDFLRAVNALMVPVKVGGRRLRKLIENKRKEILFSTVPPMGYFLPVDKDADPIRHNREVIACVGQCDSYIRGMAARRKGILDAYPDAAQMRIGEAI